MKKHRMNPEQVAILEERVEAKLESESEFPSRRLESRRWMGPKLSEETIRARIRSRESTED